MEPAGSGEMKLMGLDEPMQSAEARSAGFTELFPQGSPFDPFDSNRALLWGVGFRQGFAWALGVTIQYNAIHHNSIPSCIARLCLEFSDRSSRHIL